MFTVMLACMQCSLFDVLGVLFYSACRWFDRHDHMDRGLKQVVYRFFQVYVAQCLQVSWESGSCGNAGGSVILAWHRFML